MNLNKHKKLILLVVFVVLVLAGTTLSGCQTFKDNTVTTVKKYDPNEYNNYINLHVELTAISDSCNNGDIIARSIPSVKRAYHRAYAFSFYSKNKPLTKPVKILGENIAEFLTRYQSKPYPSVKYCEIKTSSLIELSTTILQAVGRQR